MKQEFLEVGQIVSTHGVRGEVKVMPWADEPAFLLEFDTLYLGGRPVRVRTARVQKTCVLLKLEGVDDLDAAAALRGQVLSIRRADARLPEGSVFIADLIGLPVFSGGETVGTLTDILCRPGNGVRRRQSQRRRPCRCTGAVRCFRCRPARSDPPAVSC